MKQIATFLVAVAIFSLVWTCKIVHADESAFPNRAATSELPRGPGLAAKFIADEGIDTHAAVIFADQFEQENSGGLAKRWDSTGAGVGRFLSLVDSGNVVIAKEYIGLAGSGQ